MSREQELSFVEMDTEFLDMLPGIFVVLNEQGEITKAGEEFSVLTGYSSNNLRNKKLADLVFESEATAVNEFIDSILSSDNQKTDLSLINRWGTPLSLFLTGKRIKLEGAQHILIQGFELSGTDLFSRGYIQGKKDAAGEYEMEIGKIYHRVNNNLAVLSSLFDLKKSGAEEPAVRQLLSKTQSRINTFALLHESMYQSSKSRKVPIKMFVSRLVKKIGNTFELEKKNLKLQTDVDEFHLPIEKALPFALLTNEILINSVEHAFEQRKEGRINIDIQTRKNKARAILSDTGIGMSDFKEEAESESFGLKLIQIYMKQLGAEWKVDVNEGVTYEIIFEIV